MAEIYLAAPGDGTGPQRVAIKVIHQQNAFDPDFVRMLIDEAKLAVQLDHPNIVSTYDLGHENNQYYIVMEYIEGADLFKVQQRAAVKRLSFPIALGAFVTREVARGLEFAHRLKDQNGRPLYIVHRDISPQNVLVSYEGDVKITDFGIAKAAHRAEQTQAGIIKGKYYYMSPEQAAGRVIDARTDIFAAGILLYEMLIGEMLYYDDDLDKLLAIVRKADIPPPSKQRRDVPPALEAIVMKALRKRPEERYQTAEEYGIALDGFLKSFAPDYQAPDLGVFITRVMDAPKDRQRRRVGRSAPILPLRESVDDLSPTVGISSDQMARLGVRDENSLIFQPAEKLQALLSGTGDHSGPQRSERSGFLQSRDDSGLQTRRRSVDQKTEIDPELLEQTVPDETDRARGRSTKVEKGPGWSDELEGLRTNPLVSDARVTRKHFGGNRFPIGASSDDLHEHPTVSHDAVPSISAVPVGSAADDEHDSPTARRPVETARLARVSMELPAIDVTAAKATYAAETAAREANRSLVFELMPQPTPSESPVELVVSDDGFARVPPSPVGTGSGDEPKVELTQSDLYPSLNRVIPPAEAAQSLDAISIESTQENYGEPGRPPPPPSQASVAPPPSSHSRLGYVLSGLIAALVSAVITWRVTTGTRGPLPPSDDSAATPKLVLYHPIPTDEPPPAPLVPSGAGENRAAPDGPAQPTGTDGAGKQTAAEDAGGRPTSNSEAGQIDLSSTPDGAEVYIHRKLQGTTPLVLRDLPLDSDVKVELRLEGFKKTRKRIKWKGETSLTVNVKMRTLDDTQSDGDSDGEGGDKEGAPAAKDAPATSPSKEESAKDTKETKDTKDPAKE